MSTTPVARNGVDTPALLATVDAIKGTPELAKFQFRAVNQWVSGTHSRTAIQGFYGAGQEDTSRAEPFLLDADHPPVLVGDGNGPTPAEYLLHAIASCLTAGLATLASINGISLTRVTSTVEGDIDLLGLLGLSDQVRNGYQAIRVQFVIEGDAAPEELRALVEQTRARSSVYDVLTNGVSVDIDVSTV
ncbi:hypothetical protein Acor_50520 [Acrocarpospora corrugata]|uniref:Osmotically inducible protein C n=1 Tax=Acrocarpospora corrugata TaxID=35763 RepID=A0A5M3W2P0_9ACTN|nr:OsmC family protein [Acrocarpospora corrugata]GES02986.1 hypothetical protein Acor_50520 [Acrocarpospora corrugata]